MCVGFAFKKSNSTSIIQVSNRCEIVALHFKLIVQKSDNYVITYAKYKIFLTGQNVEKTVKDGIWFIKPICWMYILHNTEEQLSGFHFLSFFYNYSMR